MPISKFVALIGVVCSALFLAEADGIPSTSAEAFYRMHFSESPAGAYEWPEKDLVFAKVCLSYKSKNIDADELSETRRVLREWLADKAAKKRVDEELCFGWNKAREICRKFSPYLEYDAAWNYSCESNAFTYEVGRDRVVVTVFRASDLLKTMPEAFLKPVSRSVWEQGLKGIVQKYYSRQKDMAFMWRLGAMDCYDVQRSCVAKFPNLENDNVVEDLKAYYGALSSEWTDVDCPILEDYSTAWKEISEYLVDSPRAKQFVEEARSVIKPKPVVDDYVTVLDENSTTNATIVCTTNSIAASEREISLSTKKCNQKKGSMILPIAVDNNEIESIIEEYDEGFVEEIETITIRKTTLRKIRKASTVHIGTPTFEKLFLSAGCLDNEPRPQTVTGKDAQKAFGMRISKPERESRILFALRENPGDASLWNLYGRLLQESSDHLGAIVCFRNALRLDRSHQYALTNMAVCYDAIGHHNLAVATAILARGVASDQWCLRHIDKILDE